MNLHPCALRVAACAAAIFTLSCSGCATKPGGTQVPADAIYVEGETVTPTGSRISQTVKKGKPAGVAPGMAGTITGGKDIEHAQNDALPAGELGAGHGPE